MNGPVAVLLSCGLCAAAGVCVASWGYARRPSEMALAAGTVGFALAYAVVHLLGWLQLLSRPALLGATVGAALAPIALSLGTSRGRGRLREAAGSLWLFFRESVALPWRQRSLAGIGALAALLIAGWTAWLAYLAPSSAWDGVMYHEPMVGYALQNGGFAWVGLEHANRMLAPVDGYPRLSENLMLFLVAAWDRRLIDLVPSALLPLLLVAVYVLLRRFVQDKLAALGFASALVLIPGVILQLRSTYVDLGFATFTAVSLAFVCRRRIRPWDLWMAGVAIGLLGSSKVTGFVVTPIVGAVGLAATSAQAIRDRRPSLPLHALGGLLLVALLMGPTYVRNWLQKDNPLWPGAVEVEALGIDWEGPLDITNMNVPTERAIEWFFGPPIANEQFHDTKDNGYGDVPPFVVPPLALLGLLLALRRSLLGPDRGRAALLLAVTVPLLATLALSPARHWARLNLHVVLAAFLLAAWFAGWRRRPRLAEGAAAAMILGNLVTLHWAEPAWDVDLQRMERLAGMDPVTRAAQRDEVFTLMPTETALARERELSAGDLLVHGRVPWVGLMWNERFDNRVEFIDSHEHGGRRWVAEAERRGAEWAVVGGRSSVASFFRDSPRWEEVGPADATDRPTVAFRRLPVRAQQH